MEENESFYSHQQRESAEGALELLYTLACPTVEDLKKLSIMNSVQDCPVTLEDYKLAQAIYGPDMFSSKGKLMCGLPSPVVQDIMEIQA